MKQLFMILTVAFVMVLGGCSLFAAVERSDLSVRIAVAEFIDGDAITATKVITFAEEAVEKLDGDPVVNLVNLRAEAYALIPWDQLSGGQRVLAGALLQTIEGKLRDQMQDPDGKLSKDAFCRLRQILGRIKDAAESELALAMMSQGAPQAKPVMMDTVQADVGFGDSLTPEVGVGKPSMAITDVGFGEGISPDVDAVLVGQVEHARPSDPRV